MRFLAFAREMLGNLFKSPATVEYPLKPRALPAGNRGKVVNTIENCIFCGMCMRVCPSSAITVDRTARTWTINRFACVQCKGCVDRCPKKCLRMEAQYTEPAREKTGEVLHGTPLPPPALKQTMAQSGKGGAPVTPAKTISAAPGAGSAATVSGAESAQDAGREKSSHA